MTILRQPSAAGMLRRIERIVGRLGFGRGPLDLRGLGPLEAIAAARGRPFVVDLPLEACRGQGNAAFPCVPGAGHPYLETALALIAEPDLAYEDSPLRRYYECLQPRTAADSVGTTSTHPDLQDVPLRAFLPWHEPAGPEIVTERLEELRRENLSHGLTLGAEHGNHHFGPVSLEKGAMELARLKALVEVIRREGFRLLPGPDGVPRVQILVAGTEWRALVQRGHHRIAVLAALGAERAPVWPRISVVRREEAQDWPSVRAGLFTRDEALAVFDRIFAGRQPDALDPVYWREGSVALRA